MNGAARWGRRLDRVIELIGQTTAWLTLLLVLLVAFDVGARYLFHVSWVPEQEFEWHVLAVIALIAASFTLQQGEHVRVDVFYQHYSEHVKRWLDVLLPIVIVVPVGLFIAYMSLHFVEMSYAINEGSPDPGGLPDRWLLKAFVPIGFALVALQGVAMFLLALVNLYTHPQQEH
ncbi:C4-dicarboxylate ABC transporter permease [Halothiobacillus diazotrophicus]|uniref:TRAP transporter small permease protein n=1 Tax=Halothiobacillus diazotrophicus TaxID=1860122 RepID=A0A191ZKA6_9GAMM|nr:C4-dicarboxylate ABC transporter permease [Halothiobacillus diazotrophicus]